MHTSSVAVFTALTLLIAPAANAADSLGAQMTNITEQTELLKAQIEREELRAKLAKLSGSSAPRDSRRATVEWVEGIGPNRAAMIRLGEGWRMEVSVGDRLPDGAQIREIRANRVSIVRNGRTEWLEFSGGASAQAAPVGASASTIAFPQ